MSNWLPLTETDRSEMLKELGVDSFEQLIEFVPKDLRISDLNIPDGLNELELMRKTKALAQTNQSTSDFMSYLGAGCYEHFIPSIVNHMLSRGEFYTAYTPYQAEASQGTLQTIFEYQSMMSELTGMDLSNASNYDGASATAEAALLALRHTRRNKILVSKSLHPDYRSTIQTYLSGDDYVIEEINWSEKGFLDQTQLLASLDKEVAALIVQTPNFFGVVEDFEKITEKVHEVGALLVAAVNPISCGLFKGPGQWGADIAVGEGQSLGVPMALGGPALGFFAVKKALMRKIPGRLAGMTTDRNGNRCFTLTLQAREQHIRREKAGSNICTNQALLALAACVYLSAMGKEGVRKVSEYNFRSALYLKEQLSKVKGLEIVFSGTSFNEFVIRSKNVSVSDIQKQLKDFKIFGGVDLGRFYSEFKDCLLICATETKTKEDLDKFVNAMKQILS